MSVNKTAKAVFAAARSIDGTFHPRDVQEIVGRMYRLEIIYEALVRLKSAGMVAMVSPESPGESRWAVISVQHRRGVRRTLASVDRDVYEKYCAFTPHADRRRRRESVRKFSEGVNRMAPRAKSLWMQIKTVVSDEHGVEGHIYTLPGPRGPIYKSTSVEGLWGFLYGYGFADSPDDKFVDPEMEE